MRRVGSLVAAAGSVFAALRLSCPEACGILVSQSGIEPMAPELQGAFLTTGLPEKSLFPRILTLISLSVVTFVGARREGCFVSVGKKKR